MATAIANPDVRVEENLTAEKPRTCHCYCIVCYPMKEIPLGSIASCGFVKDTETSIPPRNDAEKCVMCVEMEMVSCPRCGR